MRWPLLVAMGLLAMGTTTCSKPHRQAKRAEGRYTLDPPTQGWARIRPGGADFGWFHSDTSASIYWDSNCLARFEDGELGDLLTHLTFGIASGQPIREESLTLNGRDALLRVHEGAIDGVPVRVGAVVTKKDECIYDGLYIAPPRNFESQWNTFVEVMNGFKTRGR
jgi:hypothetical protein